MTYLCIYGECMFEILIKDKRKNLVLRNFIVKANSNEEAIKKIKESVTSIDLENDNFSIKSFHLSVFKKDEIWLVL